ncbi:MAG: hypothetical protein ACYTGO_13270 [Planctomycetota bacterium]
MIAPGFAEADAKSLWQQPQERMSPLLGGGHRGGGTRNNSILAIAAGYLNQRLAQHHTLPHRFVHQLQEWCARARIS